jgi:chitosanase
MLTPAQQTTILKVINVFETGKPEGRYDAVVVMKDGRNHSRQITYGRSQTTEQGNLKSLLLLYAERGGIFAPNFAPYLPKLGVVPLADDVQFKKLLKTSAKEDSIMRRAQDIFFDRVYFQPAQDFFDSNRFVQALSLLVIYDSYIHSGGVPPKLRNRFPENTPRNGGREEAWTSAYVRTRHEWLANHGNRLLRRTIYRTRCFQEQIDADNWDLIQPFRANNVLVHVHFE